MRQLSLALLAILLSGLFPHVLVAQTLYGLTRTTAQMVKLVEINESTGAVSSTVATYDVGTNAVFTNLTYHSPSGKFLALSGGKAVTPELLVIDPVAMSSSVLPITGLPPAQQDAGGLEYWDAENRIMITGGLNFQENHIAEINLAGTVINAPVALGLIDSDFLGKSHTGELLSVDYNEGDRTAVATVADPFGAIQVVETSTDPPSNSNIVGTAVVPVTGELLAVDLASGELVRVDTNAFTPIGSLGTTDIVIGLEFATLASADFDMDDDVDGTDFLALQRGFGTISGANKSQGDANDDGAVDSNDFKIWEAQYGHAPPPSAATTALPEPTTYTLGLVGLCLFAKRRR